MKTIYRLFVLMFFILAIHPIGFSQEIVQTIKGRLVDKDSQMPLPGANVVVASLDTPKGTSTGTNGYFEITGIPVGRHTIKASFIGYEPVVYSEVLVGSGKEIVLNISLTERIIKLDDVVVTPDNSKGEALNTMSMVSARGFHVEETRRYAGGFDDPVRLASVYAGVASSGSVESNAIMIRGNSPVGVLWQVEGMAVPNPTHFANADMLGGGAITMFNTHILSNSDFYTGAFPSEFGNAYSGVFDIRFRDGNTTNYEHAFQIGAMGIDFASEGPIYRKKRASYLFNYRYSTLGLLSQFMPEGEGLPIYQDLSFKMKTDLDATSSLSIWGLGAIDEFNKCAEEDPELWKYEKTRYQINADYKSGSTGISYRKLFENHAYLNASIAASGYYQVADAQWLDEELQYVPLNKSTYFDSRLSTKVLYNTKHSAKLTSRIGMIYNYLNYKYDIRIADDGRKNLIQVSDTKGNASLWQVFAQTKYNVLQNVTIHAGVHSMYFNLNNKISIEPRLGANWQFNPRHSLSAAYGLHAQQQLLSVYFVEKTENGKVTYPNKDLDFTRAQHFVMAYDLKLSKNSRIRIEPYYQILSNLAVVQNSPVAMINVKDMHDFKLVLESTGSGCNYGIDLTYERFLHNGFYFLTTASVFESKYTGSDGIERNTLFNNKFLMNVLGGKEWKLGAKENKILGINARVYIKGGDRITPPDITATEDAQEIIYDYNKAFEKQAPTTYRFDFTATYQINKPDYAVLFGLQINNALSSPTIYEDVFDYTTKSIREMKDGNPFPNMFVKIEF